MEISKIPPMADNKENASETDFFCHACLAYHPEEYRSRDKRYCQFSYDLMHEKYTDDTDPVGAVTDREVEVDRQLRPVQTMFKGMEIVK